MNAHTWYALVALSLVLALIVPADGAMAQEGEGRLRVVASFSILADVVRNVAGDAADVTSLIPIGAGPHGYIPTPQDLVALAEADVVFIVGANFEEGLLGAIASAGEGINVVVASSCVAILPYGDIAHDGHDDDEDEDHPNHAEARASDSASAALCAAHHDEMAALRAEEEDEGRVAPLGMLYTLDCGGPDAHYADEGEHAHEAGSCDPHVWTDPHNVMLWAMMARDTLSALDPANAATYAENAAAYIVALDELARGFIRPAIDSIPEANRKLVTNHVAYSYLANAYGLEMVGTVIPGASTLAEPSAAEVAALIDALRAQGVPAVFAEVTANPQLAEQIAAEADVSFYTLFTGTLSDADGPASSYIDYMRHEVRVIVEALGGTIAGE